MPSQTSRPTPAARRCSSAERVMWITPERVFYAGLLGAPSLRTMGAIVVYVALEQPILIRLDGGEWQTTEVAVVQPYVPHQVACSSASRHIGVVKVEPETVDAERLPPLLRHASGAVDAPEFAAHVRRCHARLVEGGARHDLIAEDFDTMMFGHRLPASSLDPRIAAVLERISRDPSAQAVAEECAAEARLSFSRFLHLFKQEVGAPFRSFRTWKRARSLLHYVHAETSLTHVALDAGYPDSTHFSHSIRQVYGLKPKDIFAGSRKLRVIDRQPPDEVRLSA